MNKRSLQTKGIIGAVRRCISVLLTAAMVLSGTYTVRAEEMPIFESGETVSEVPIFESGETIPETSIPENGEEVQENTVFENPEEVRENTVFEDPEEVREDTVLENPESVREDTVFETLENGQENIIPETVESDRENIIPEAVETDPAAAELRNRVQELIDALPDTVTAENAEEVKTRLSAIDEAKAELTDEELDALDMAKYMAAVDALLELEGMAGANEAELLAGNVVGDFTIEGGTEGTDFVYKDNSLYNMSNYLQILTDTPLTIRNTDPGTVAADIIYIAKDVNANITLDGVNICGDGTPAFYISDNSAGNVTVTLKGENTLKGGFRGAGLQKAGTGGTLTVQGSGILNAIGGSNAAGIGGTYHKGTDGIIIISGTVNATGGEYGAGIGGGDTSAGNITIQGGTVTANGGRYGAGIGGGDCGNGTATITGGTVKATGGEYGAGIGGRESGTVTITGGTVKATGRESSVGIGGRESGTVMITGGTVTAYGGPSGSGIGSGKDCKGGMVTITGGTITARGGQAGAGIGNGENGSGCTFSTGENGSAFIVATGGSGVAAISDNSDTSAWRGVIIQGSEGRVYGTNMTLETSISIPSGINLIIPMDTVLTVPSGVTLTNRGTISVYGELVYTGTVTNVDGGTLLRDYGDFKVSGNMKASFDVDNGMLIVQDGAAVTISMKDGVTVPTADCIKVADGAKADITLSGVNIEAGDDKSAFQIQDGSTVTVTLVGDNILKGGFRCAGMQVDDPSSSLTIQGNGSLAVIGGGESAGIGGGYYCGNGSGNITILGGTITAAGGGAGIGGASNNKAGSGTITIQGGNITATGNSGSGGAGIGGGAHGSGSTIIINGGTVNATGGYSSAGIGGGWGTENDRITITGGTVTATGGPEGAGIGDGSGGQTSSVTITGGMVTAIAGSGGGTPSDGIGNGAYYMAGGHTSHGTFSTGENGSVVIFASSISDQTGKEAGSWKGIIFEDKNGQVYGNITLPQNLAIPEDMALTILKGASLTVPGGMTLTNNGVLTIGRGGSLTEGSTIDGSGTFLTENLTEDMINVPSGLIYNGTDLSETIPAQVTLTNPTVCGREFQLAGWDLSVVKSSDSDADYIVTYTHANGTTVTKTVTVAQSGTTFTAQLADGKTYYAYTDTITITASVTPTGETPAAAAANARLREMSAPNAGQVAVYDENNHQVSDPVAPDEQGKCTITISARDLGVGKHTLTARFLESAVMAGATVELGTVNVVECPHSSFTEVGVCEVCGTQAAATVTVDGENTYYFEFISAWNAAKDKNATITMLKDQTVSEELCVSAGGNITLKAANDGITLTGNIDSGYLFRIPGNTAVAFESGSYYASATAKGIMVEGGTVNITGGTFTAYDSALFVQTGTVTLSGGKFIVDENITINSGYDPVLVGSMLADGYAYKTSTGWITRDTPHITYLRGSVEVLPVPVKITGQPKDPDPLVEGYTTSPTISVTAEAADTESAISYQWYEVKGETAEELTGEILAYFKPGFRDPGTYQFYCTVTCDGFTVNSDTVTFTVIPCPHPGYTITPTGGAECTQCGMHLEAAVEQADGISVLYGDIEDAWEAALAMEGMPRVKVLSLEAYVGTEENGDLLTVPGGRTILVEAGFENANIKGRIEVEQGGTLILGCSIMVSDSEATYPTVLVNGTLHVKAMDGAQMVGLTRSPSSQYALVVGQTGDVTLSDCCVEGIQIDENNTQVNSVASALGEGYDVMMFDENDNPVWVSMEDLAGKSCGDALLVMHPPVGITGQPTFPDPLEPGYTEAPRLTVAAETAYTEFFPEEYYPTAYQWYQVSQTEDGTDILIQEEGTGYNTNTFTVPIGLEAGEYQYYCAVSRAGYTVKSDIVTVTVNNRYFTVTIQTDGNCSIEAVLMDSEDAGTVLRNGDMVPEGAALKVTTKANEGYELTSQPKVDYIVEGDLPLIATASAKTYALTVNHENGAAPEADAPDLNAIPRDTTVTLTAGAANEGYEFIGWYQPNGKLLSADKEYSVYMNTNLTVEARYQKKAGVVTFVANNQVKGSFTGNEIKESDFPVAPSPYSGFEFTGWDKTVAEINAALTDGQSVTVTAQFAAIKQENVVTVYNGEAETPETVTLEESKWYSVTAAPVAGKNFAYWTMDGAILTYGQTATVFVVSDCTLKAVYSVDVTEAMGTALLKTATYRADTRKLSMVAYLTVPENCKIVSSGLVAASGSGSYDANVELTKDNAEYVKVSSAAVGRSVPVTYTWTKSNVSIGDVWYARAYVTYTDPAGLENMVYGDRVAVTAGQSYDAAEKATAKITSSSYNASTKKAAFVSYTTVPEGAVISKAGLVAASDATFNADNTILTAENAAYVKSSPLAVGKSVPVTYTWTKGNVSSGDTWYVRAYLVYTLNGAEHTVYGTLVRFTA